MFQEVGTAVHMYRNLVYMTHLERTVRAHIPAPHGEVSLVEMECKATSLVLVNTHFALIGSRPDMLGVAQITGIHCRPAKALSQELEQFVNGAGDAGFIFFSMGGTITAKLMPLRLAFLEAFLHLPQRVLWKWEGNMSDIPPNVLLSSWLPQQDILGHRKLRLFIMQGGMLSLQEAVYNGVPMLVASLLMNQETNTDHAVYAGYGVRLDLLSATPSSILNGLNFLLNDPKYKHNAMQISTIFRDQPESPLERVIWWTEYVLRHKGSLHLKGSNVNAPWYQQQALDVAVIFILSTIICVAMLLKCIELIHKALT